MLNSNNYNLVKDRIEEFKQVLQEFKEAHAAYHSQLRDENEIKGSNDYYDAAVLLRLLPTFAGATPEKNRTRASFNKTPTNYIS